MSLASSISTTSLYIWSLGIGALFGFFLRTNSDNPDKLYRQLSSVSIGILLPIHVGLTMLNANSLEQLAYFVPVFVAGPVCCSAILLVTHFAAKSPGFRSYDPHFKYVSSTMGGGGRAVVLLAAFMPLIDLLVPSTSLPQTALDIFAIFDVGYWLFYTAVVFSLMQLSFTQGAEARHPELYKFETFGVVIGAGVGAAVQYLGKPLVLALGSGILADIRFALTCLIVVFSAAAVVLKAGGWKFHVVARSIGFIVSTRALGLALPALVFPPALSYLFEVPTLYFLLPMLLMLLLPPSSLVDRMLLAKGASDDQARDIVNINVTWNVLLVMVGLAGLLAYYLAGWLLR